MIIKNARIAYADIVMQRGFALDCSLHLEFDDFHQGFGGYILGGNPFDETAAAARHHEQKNLAADFIGGVMAVAGVDKFSDLVGKIVRVRKSDDWNSPIHAIGHPVKDLWYCPDERLKILNPV